MNLCKEARKDKNSTWTFNNALDTKSRIFSFTYILTQTVSNLIDVVVDTCIFCIVVMIIKVKYGLNSRIDTVSKYRTKESTKNWYCISTSTDIFWKLKNLFCLEKVLIFVSLIGFTTNNTTCWKNYVKIAMNEHNVVISGSPRGGILS